MNWKIEENKAFIVILEMFVQQLQKHSTKTNEKLVELSEATTSALEIKRRMIPGTTNVSAIIQEIFKNSLKAMIKEGKKHKVVANVINTVASS